MTGEVIPAGTFESPQQKNREEVGRLATRTVRFWDGPVQKSVEVDIDAVLREAVAKALTDGSMSLDDLAQPLLESFVESVIESATITAIQARIVADSKKTKSITVRQQVEKAQPKKVRPQVEKSNISEQDDEDYRQALWNKEHYGRYYPEDSQDPDEYTYRKSRSYPIIPEEELW